MTFKQHCIHFCLAVGPEVTWSNLGTCLPVLHTLNPLTSLLVTADGSLLSDTTWLALSDSTLTRAFCLCSLQSHCTFPLTVPDFRHGSGGVLTTMTFLF